MLWVRSASSSFRAAQHQPGNDHGNRSLAGGMRHYPKRKKSMSDNACYVNQECQRLFMPKTAQSVLMKHVTLMAVWALVLAVVVAFATGQNPATLTLEATGGEVTCIGFSSNGQAFFSGALDSSVSVWTTTDWKRSAEIEPEPPPKAAAGEHQDEYRSLAACAVEPNAVQAIIASGGDLISAYALPGGKLVGSHRLPANDG